MAIPAWISALISLLVSMTFFGIGAAIILSIPSLGIEAQLLLPVIVVAAIFIAPIVAGRLAPLFGASEKDGVHE